MENFNKWLNILAPIFIVVLGAANLYLGVSEDVQMSAAKVGFWQMMAAGWWLLHNVK